MQTIVDSGVAGESVVTFEVRSHAGVLILSAVDLTDHEMQVLFQQILDLTRRVEGRLVLDATLVRPLNCGWINRLIDLHHRCSTMGGRLVIAGLPADAEDVIRSTGLTRHLSLVSTREDGVKLLSTRNGRGSILEWLFGRAA